MAMSLLLLPAVFASLFVSAAVSDSLISPIIHEKPPSCSGDLRSQNSFRCEVEEAKLKVARLESVLEERIGEIDARREDFRACERKIEELTAEIDRLEKELASFEDDYSSANGKLDALEEEVRLLWADSRRNNFEISTLEYKALDAERRLKEVASKAGEMAEIVSEQWIQVQQLEQAVHMAQLRTSKIRKELWRRCPFVKFFTTLVDDCLKILEVFLDTCVPRGALAFCKSRALQTFDAAKQYHHQLQGLIRNAMKSSELTAALSHEEVVFFVTSVLVAFPIMVACMMLLSQFS